MPSDDESNEMLGIKNPDYMSKKALTADEAEQSRRLFDRITKPTEFAGNKDFPSPPYPPVTFKGTVDGGGCDL